MSKVTLNLPVNNVSFGFVGYQLLRQFDKAGVNFDFAAMNNQLDFSSFDKSTEDFKQRMTAKAQNFYSSYSRKNPVVRLWHVGGSEFSIGNGNHLFTFHELDSLTPTEVNILNNQEQIFVSSQETKETMETYGVKVPVNYLPLGYDSEHFRVTNKKYLGDSTTVFLIHGKAEKRKGTERAIKLWIKKFGNDSRYRLHAQIFNPFFTPEQNKQLVSNLLEGKEVNNVNFFGYLPTLSSLNDLYNAANIVIDASGAEGWSLPSFHTIGLGKHGVVHNVTAMKGWANSENSVLFEPDAKEPAADGVFFAQDGQFNIGNIYHWSDESYLNALEEVVKRKNLNKLNAAGLELPKTFTWENTFSILREKIGF